MKRLFLSVLLVGFSVRADILPPAPASTNDVQAGTSTSKFISPWALANAGVNVGLSAAAVAAQIAATNANSATVYAGTAANANNWAPTNGLISYTTPSGDMVVSNPADGSYVITTKSGLNSTRSGTITAGGFVGNGKFLTTTQGVITVDASQWLTNTYYSLSPTYAGVSALTPSDAAWTNMLSVVTNMGRRVRLVLPVGFVKITNAIEFPVGIDFVGHGYFHSGAYSHSEVTNSYTVIWQANTNNDGIHVAADQGAPTLGNFEVCGRTNPVVDILGTVVGMGLIDPFYSPLPGVTNNSIYAKVGISVRGVASGAYCGGVMAKDLVVCGFKIGMWNEGNFETFTHCQFSGNDIGVINGPDLSPPSFSTNGWPGINLPLYFSLHDSSLQGGAPDQVAFIQPGFGVRSNGVCIVNGSGGVTINNSSDINFKTYGIVYGTHELTVIGGHSEINNFAGTNLILGFDGPGNSILTRNWDVINTVGGATNVYGDNMTNWTYWYDPASGFRNLSLAGKIQGIPGNSGLYGASPIIATAQGDFTYNYPVSATWSGNNYYSGLNVFTNQISLQNGTQINSTKVGGDMNAFTLTSAASDHYFEMKFPNQGQTTYNMIPLSIHSYTGGNANELVIGGSDASEAAVGFNQITIHMSVGGGTPSSALIFQDSGGAVNFGGQVPATLGNGTYNWAGLFVTNATITSGLSLSFTNAAPVNATTPVLWYNITNKGVVYKAPLYQ